MESFFLVNKRHLSTTSRGFTLIEMLMVLAIIVIITGIALSGQSGFNSTLSLNNTTYDIGLSIQLAQSYGLSSQVMTQSSNTVRNAGYGVQFDTSLTDSYAFFADTSPNLSSVALPDAHPGNGYYDTAPELVQTYTLNNGFTLGTFCAKSTSIASVCSVSGGLSALAISFTRPNTETIVKGKVGNTWNTYDSACITVVSSNGSESKYLTIAQTGQISMATSCSL